MVALEDAWAVVGEGCRSKADAEDGEDIGSLVNNDNNQAAA